MIFMFSFSKILVNFRERVVILLLLPALLIVASVEAGAHAKLLRSLPADGEILGQVPKTVVLEFNQKMQTGSMNSIFVTDDNGKRVDKNLVVVSEDGKNLQIELENLASGTYSVEWKTLSADEHLIKGSFKFRLGASENETKTAATAPENDFQKSFAPLPKILSQKSGVSWSQPVARWISHLALTLLFGGFAFLLLVLKPALRLSSLLRDEERTVAFQRGNNIFIRIAWLNLSVFSVSAFVALVLQTLVVFEMSNANLPANLLRTLTETSFGAPWLLQAALAILLFAVVFFINLQNRKNDFLSTSDNSKTSLLWVGFAVCALLFLAPSLTGHARAAAREYPFAVVSQWLHLVAVGVWVGGLFHLALILPKSVGNLDGGLRLSVLAEAIARFSRFAVVFSILLALTGVYNSVIHVQDFSSLWTTDYGIVLTAKIAAFLPMLALGGFNSFVIRPRLARLTETLNSERKLLNECHIFYRALGIEILLGAIALLLAAALAFIPLGHQH